MKGVEPIRFRQMEPMCLVGKVERGIERELSHKCILPAGHPSTMHNCFCGKLFK